MSDNIIQVNQEIIHTELKDLVRTSVEETLSSIHSTYISIYTCYTFYNLNIFLFAVAL